MKPKTEALNIAGVESVKVPDCINDDYCLKTPKSRSGILTMAFVDMQPLESVYDSDGALKSGTLFPNLDKPFVIGEAK